MNVEKFMTLTLNQLTPSLRWRTWCFTDISCFRFKMGFICIVLEVGFPGFVQGSDSGAEVQLWAEHGRFLYPHRGGGAAELLPGRELCLGGLCCDGGFLCCVPDSVLRGYALCDAEASWTLVISDKLNFVSHYEKNAEKIHVLFNASWNRYAREQVNVERC